jgi:hypothetical protein
MNSAVVINSVRIVGCVAAFIAIFQNALGLPEWATSVGATVGTVCFLGAWRLQIRYNRLVGEHVPSHLRERRTRRQTWLLLLVVTGVLLSSPFWLPYTGITLGFGQLWLSAIVTWLVVVSLIVFRGRAIGNRGNK